MVVLLQALSASAPLIALWDDHEFVNNVSMQLCMMHCLCPTLLLFYIQKAVHVDGNKANFHYIRAVLTDCAVAVSYFKLHLLFLFSNIDSCSVEPISKRVLQS